MSVKQMYRPVPAAKADRMSSGLMDVCVCAGTSTTISSTVQESIAQLEAVARCSARKWDRSFTGLTRAIACLLRHVINAAQGA